MDKFFNFAKVHLKIEGEFEVAPIDLHYLSGHLTELLKVISELERNGGNRRNLSTELSIQYAPVKGENR